MTPASGDDYYLRVGPLWIFQVPLTLTRILVRRTSYAAPAAARPARRPKNVASAIERPLL